METVALIMVMLLVGLLLGFVGAGGSGFMIAVLTVGFGYPIHVAMGTAIAAMMLTSLSGMLSQLRQQNTDIATGILVGITGALGSWVGSGIAFTIPESAMKWCTSGMLVLSGLALWLKLSMSSRDKEGQNPIHSPARRRITAVCVGLTVGVLTGTFGIGSTPFIQLGLMLLLGLSMRRAAGTSMLIILFVAAAGAVGYFQAGSLNVPLLFTVLAGSMTGSYIGARFTKRAPAALLKTGMVATPIAAAFLLLL